METQFNELIRHIKEMPVNLLLELDTEHLDKRLLKGKYDVYKFLGYKNVKGLSKAEGNLNYLKGAAFFLMLRIILVAVATMMMIG